MCIRDSSNISFQSGLYIYIWHDEHDMNMQNHDVMWCDVGICYLQNNFFRPLGKIADRAKYFACVEISSFFFIFLLWAKLHVSHYLLDRFSRSFHQTEGICVNFLDLVQFFRFLKGRCHGNQLSREIAFLRTHPLTWPRPTYARDGHSTTVARFLHNILKG